MTSTIAYRIPLFDLAFDDREYEAVLQTLRERWISMGPRTEEFERRFAELLGTPHAAAVSNCTAALHLALLALGVGRDDEVIVPSLTFVATVAAVRYVGAAPVFCDVQGPQNPTIDPEQIERSIGPKTRAIVVMHYAGFPCDMDPILAIAKRHGLAVVEDAAHAPGSRYRGRALGTIGDIGCFSFFSNKNITTAEGGMITTGDPERFRRIKLLRSHGMTTLSFDRARGHSTTYDVVEVGYNYRLDDIRAALGIVQLGRLSLDRERRILLRQRYLSRLAEREDVIVPFQASREEASNYILPIVLRESSPADRESVRNELARRGIQTSVHYPAVHKFSVYQPFTRALPKTEYFADRTLTLPLYPALQAEQVDEVCDALADVLDDARAHA
jgi:dTDP-4-amino-4,6-dideoxygalactose transaminase